MSASPAFSRFLIAVPYIASGADALLNSQAHRKQGEKFATWLEKINIKFPVEHLSLITRISGGAMIAAGSALAAGRFRKLAAAGILALQIPVSLARHPFWEQENSEKNFDILYLISDALLLYAAQVAGWSNEYRSAGHK